MPITLRSQRGSTACTKEYHQGDRDTRVRAYELEQAGCHGEMRWEQTILLQQHLYETNNCEGRKPEFISKSTLDPYGPAGIELATPRLDLVCNQEYHIAGQLQAACTLHDYIHSH
jgi:hypothetical protein